MTSLTPPFSARLAGQHRKINEDFPDAARIGLLHLMLDLVERNYIADWAVLARELHRIGRRSIKTYDVSSLRSIEEAQVDVDSVLMKLQWPKVFDFCERLHGHLANEVIHEDNYGGQIVEIARSDSQAYIANELQRLFLEEGLVYEFSDGAVRRTGRKHTVDKLTKSQAVLGDPRLIDARGHFDKALKFFRHATNPDHENAVKEAVCAVEAAGKTLFPKARATTLADVIRWLERPSEVALPKTICQTLTGVYAFRSGGEGVAHGGANGGKVTPEIAEYILAICASQIILLVDLESASEAEIPF
ncbi:hypothetical protein [Roseateles sp. PN1]|uniref:hypothetical protein n=1 Tax=Roseateles sp. PN1 TaxID=3137372 RepID=UPI0031391215